MLRLIFLSFFISLNASAYTADNIHLTDNEFLRSVKPQLNNIKQDYQTLIGALNPALKKYKSTFNHFNTINRKESKFISYCKDFNNSNCIEIIDLYVKEIAAILLNMQNSPVPEDTENHPPELILVSFENFQNVRSGLLDIYFQLFQYSFFYQAKIAIKTTPQDFIKRINSLYDQFNIYLIKSSDQRFQEEFMAYWNGFIKPVTRFVLSNNEKSYFLRNINDFNLRWNVLNIELTKRNKKIPKQVSTLLQTMHRRWNNILKTTLR